jgi:hypothetical protein
LAFSTFVDGSPRACAHSSVFPRSAGPRVRRPTRRPPRTWGRTPRPPEAEHSANLKAGGWHPLARQRALQLTCDRALGPTPAGTNVQFRASALPSRLVVLTDRLFDQCESRTRRRESVKPAARPGRKRRASSPTTDCVWTSVRRRRVCAGRRTDALRPLRSRRSLPSPVCQALDCPRLLQPHATDPAARHVDGKPHVAPSGDVDCNTEPGPQPSAVADARVGLRRARQLRRRHRLRRRVRRLERRGISGFGRWVRGRRFRPILGARARSTAPGGNPGPRTRWRTRRCLLGGLWRRHLRAGHADEGAAKTHGGIRGCCPASTVSSPALRMRSCSGRRASGGFRTTSSGPTRSSNRPGFSTCTTPTTPPPGAAAAAAATGTAAAATPSQRRASPARPTVRRSPPRPHPPPPPTTTKKTP